MEEETDRMKADNLKSIIAVIFIMTALTAGSCSNRAGNAVKTSTESTGKASADLPASLIKMKSPAENDEFRLNDQVKISLEPAADEGILDSVRVSFDGKQVALLKSAPWECTVTGDFTGTTGRKPVKAVAYTAGKTQSVTRFVLIYSDSAPKRLGFRLISTYPHDPGAFTQGLFFHDGVLYEGTGQETGSTLRTAELETGRVIRQHTLDPSLFGEGITLFKDRIFQVTWQNKVGFVYNRSDFKQINKIYYQGEGWGLTTIGDKIVRSDGSNILYFHEPEMFDAVSRLEVYDNEKKVDQLNELEYINGEIWANIWMTDLIARIDPLTGKVNSYVDLTRLFPEAKRREVNADVLNGIAWDHLSGRIFVTGKRWPALYEIEVIE
ncbi:MAG: glutaminyl-peptide cyclotransferase [Bacteroidales bacterium]|nr:glutaminyl-peptide cyclotransferase [Bacteroidales bacterium]